MDRGKKL